MKSHKREHAMREDTRLALLEQSIGHINETMIRIEKRFDSLEKKVDHGFEKVDKRFEEVDKKFDKVDKRLDKFDEKLTKLDDKIENVRSQSWSQFRWIMGAIFTLFCTLVGNFIKGHLS